MELISPHIKYEESYKHYISELGDEERYPYPMDLPFHDFADLVALLTAFSKGKRMLPNMVPNSTYWLVNNNEIVAVSHLRHELNESLQNLGGHIGLGVRPKFRGQGLSTMLLNLTIGEALKKRINQLHIHCYKENAASARMIIGCGGYLDSELLRDSANMESSVVQRYLWDKLKLEHSSGKQSL